MMELELRPEILRLIDDWISVGLFATREEVIEEAIIKMWDRDRAERDKAANLEIAKARNNK
jgi:Arc/MetJ-type ribon-helix-helix transcriptional regulator